MLLRFAAGAASLLCVSAAAGPIHDAARSGDERLVVQAEIPREGEFAAFGFDSFWVMTGNDLVRVNPTDNVVTDIKIEGATGELLNLAIGEGALWIPDVGGKKIFKVDPNSNAVVATIAAALTSEEGSIGVGAGSVWAATGGTLTRYSAATGAEEATIKLPAAGRAVLFDHGAAWVMAPYQHAVYRINPQSNTVVATIPVAKFPRQLASGEGAIWVLSRGNGSVQRIDVDDNNVVATIDAKLQGEYGDVAVGGGYVWVAANLHTVAQIDPKTNSVLRRFDREAVVQIRHGAGSLWGSGSAIRRIKVPG